MLVEAALSPSNSISAEKGVRLGPQIARLRLPARQLVLGSRPRQYHLGGMPRLGSVLEVLEVLEVNPKSSRG